MTLTWPWRSAGAASEINLLFNSHRRGSGIMQSVLNNLESFNYTKYGSLAALIGIIPGAFRFFRQAWGEASSWIKHFFTASVTIPGGDPLNRSISTWLLDHIIEPRNIRFQTARTEIGGDLEQGASLKKSKRAVQYCPHWRHVWFWHDRNWFSVERSLDSFQSAMSNPTYDGVGGEELTINCLGLSVQPIRDWIELCRAYAERKTQFYVIIYSRDRYGLSWKPRTRKPLRQLDTVHFDDDSKKALLADIRVYLDPRTRKLYQSRSMPYRRGYLFYGPPGTGKSSLSTAIAGEFGLDLYEVKIPSVATDADLEQMFQEIPPRSIVLLEDIDAVWAGRSRVPSRLSRAEYEHHGSESEDSFQHGAPGTSNVTLSGLLNVLDGVGSQEGRLVIMTTNRPEQLDKALIRPGRVDFKVHLGNISRASAADMFVRMFAPDLLHWARHATSSSITSTTRAATSPGVANQHQDPLDEYTTLGQIKMLAADFAQAIPEDAFTPSQLQGFFQLHLDSAVEAAANISTWVEQELAGHHKGFEVS